MEWQPIETAPKDGTPVLAWLVNPSGDEYITVIKANRSGGWDWRSIYFEPTHWMPLPEPPKDSGE